MVFTFTPVFAGFFISEALIGLLVIIQALIFVFRRYIYMLIVKTFFTVIGVSNSYTREELSEWCKNNVGSLYFYLGGYILGDMGLEKRKDMHYFMFWNRRDAAIFRIRYGFG